MEILLVRSVLSILLIPMVATLSALAQEQAASGDQPGTVMEVSSKKYEFTPDEIHVKKGSKVQLKVHSVDEPHGVKLSLYPEGSTDKSSPGLLLSSPAQNGKAEKNKDQVLEFTAKRAGTYEFKCAKFCGFGHGRMKGKLVVDE
jgi:heme/copper-type cytochrome/quinol oxidase subunit 2